MTFGSLFAGIGGLDGQEVGGVGEVEFDAVVRKYPVEEPERAAVRVVSEHDVIAGLN